MERIRQIDILGRNWLFSCCQDLGAVNYHRYESIALLRYTVIVVMSFSKEIPRRMLMAMLTRSFPSKESCFQYT